MPSQGRHRGATHGFVLFPVFLLAVSVAVVGLGALSALGQVVAVLAALETLEHREPKRLCVGLVLLFRAVLHNGRWRSCGGVGGAVVARGATGRVCWAARLVHQIASE